MKKKEDQQQQKKADVIPAEKYWEWRFKVEEMLHAKTKVLVDQERAAHARTAEALAKVQAASSQNVLIQAKAKAESVAKGYEEFVAAMESELGFKIKGRGVNPISFEVSDIE